MSEFPVASFSDGMPASELPLAPPLLDTRRGRRAQLEVDAALDLSEANPPVRAPFIHETNWGVVFSDRGDGERPHQRML
jgi:hypothetical protein